VRILPFAKSSKHKRHVVHQVVTPFGTGERIPIETAEERTERILNKTSAKVERKAAAKVAAKAERENKARGRISAMIEEEEGVPFSTMNALL